MFDALDDLQPLRPIWIDENTVLGSLNEEGGARSTSRKSFHGSSGKTGLMRDRGVVVETRLTPKESFACAILRLAACLRDFAALRAFVLNNRRTIGFERV